MINNKISTEKYGKNIAEVLYQGWNVDNHMVKSLILYLYLQTCLEKEDIFIVYVILQCYVKRW